MKTFLVTFGLGTYLKNKCVVIEAQDEDSARIYLYKKYGKENICSIYNYEDKKGLIDKYKYEIIKEKI